MSGEPVEKDGVVVVNWLVRRELFDFSGVYINQASDEEVERFAVQIGNDTDEWRRRTYAQMRCLVATEAHLSENTLRILRRTFAAVVEMETEAVVGTKHAGKVALSAESHSPPKIRPMTISNSLQSPARPIDNSGLESSQFDQASAR
jgi:hypothetical protein